MKTAELRFRLIEKKELLLFKLYSTLDFHYLSLERKLDIKSFLKTIKKL